MNARQAVTTWAGAVCVLAFLATSPSFAGAYVFAGSANGLDLILHPQGYTGSQSVVTVRVCIAPDSLVTTNMVQPVKNIIAVFNAMESTTSNLRFGASNDVPSGQYDLESAALHELGHCVGLAHVNAASESGLSEPQRNYTKVEPGSNGTFDLNDGVDNVIGSCDDLRGDDLNLHWFRESTNDPFQKATVVDGSNYSRDLADLPATDTCNSGSHRFAANGDRSVATLLNYAPTEAVMQQGMGSDEAQRTLTADDVATLELARAGLDEIADTGDDYSVNLFYGGITTINCDVNMKMSSTSSLAFCSVGGSFIGGGHAQITSANIEFGANVVNWYYNQTPAPTPVDLTIALGGAGTGRVSSNPAGIDCGSNCIETFGGTTTVALTAVPDLYQSVFTGWSGNADCSDGNVTVSSDIACTANFGVAPKWALTIDVVEVDGTGTVTSSPAGINCPGNCSFSFFQNQPITLTATPGPDSYFVGWSGHADCTDGVVALTSARSCTATFANAILFEDGLESGDTSAWDKTEGL